MTKRVRDEADTEYDSPSKRAKHSLGRHPDNLEHIDRLSILPDELIIRVLSFLRDTDLLRCHRLSRKYHHLCEDADLWRALYYDNFVRPRLRRLRGIKELAAGSRALGGSRYANWLEDAYLLQRSNHTNWKRQFRLRSNWANGNCTRYSIMLDERQGPGCRLVQLHGGRLFSVGERLGLRVWQLKGQPQVIAQASIKDMGVPSALAIDTTIDTDDETHVIIGFESGKVISFLYNNQDGTLSREMKIDDDRRDDVTLIKATWPFVVVMTRSKCMSLYAVKDREGVGRETKQEHKFAQLVHRLESHLERKPLCMSLRVTDTAIALSIAFTAHGALGTCSLGIQELHISQVSDEVTTRLCYGVGEVHARLTEEPTSMSYNHPYLLISHTNNTLTLYLVRSDAQSLSIGDGIRLWGHTSAVSYAHVGSRGRAVSVSKTGGELRVWELEGGMVASSVRKRLAAGDLSVRVQPRRFLYRPAKEEEAASLSDEIISSLIGVKGKSHEEVDVVTERQWVGFDEENVAVLEKGRNEEQMLVIYNFA